MIPFEIVKDLHIIRLNASRLTLDKLKESLKSVNSTHFLLFHTVQFKAILNQENSAGRHLTAEQTFGRSQRTQGPCWEY